MWYDIIPYNFEKSPLLNNQNSSTFQVSPGKIIFFPYILLYPRQILFSKDNNLMEVHEPDKMSSAERALRHGQMKQLKDMRRLYFTY